MSFVSVKPGSHLWSKSWSKWSKHAQLELSGVKQEMKQDVKQAVHTYASKLRSASNEPHINNKERGKMNEEEILLALGYLLLKRRIRRRKQLQAKNVQRMWVREIFKERGRKGILFSQANSFCSCLEIFIRFIIKYGIFSYSLCKSFFCHV